MLQRLRQPWPDRRAEGMIGARASGGPVLSVLMIVFVASKAWPALQHNGFGFFGSGGDVDRQVEAMVNTGEKPAPGDYAIGAWPLIYATLLTTALAVAGGLAFALLAAIFIVEFAP